MNADIEPAQTVFNVAQAARYLGVGPRTIRRLCQQRKIVFKKVDARDTVRIHKAALDDFLLRDGGVR